MPVTMPVQQLPAATPPADGDVLPLGQGALAVRKLTLTRLFDYIKAKLPPTTNGVDGKTIIPIVGVPPPELGRDGDYAIDKTGDPTIYGPKAGGVWPAGVALKGDTGAPGTASEWALNFTADATFYIPAPVAMTIASGIAPIGTGALAYDVSSAIDPDIFNPAALPVAVEAGAWLRVTATGVVTFLAAHLSRVA